ncbi:MAG: FHA domain-containing protein [Myxococcales bacterium]|nr:FHA domain-containing protein [Myxococcales bacterium]
MGYALRYRQHEIELVPGRFVIGRAGTCQLALDDPLASREHAAISVGDTEVSVEDLDSRNGVSVNETRIAGRRALVPGDRVRIGSQELVLVSTTASPRRAARAAPTARFAVFGVVGGLADKAFALGHVDEAERLLAGPLEEIASRAESGALADADTAEKVAAYATRLALATGKGAWVDYVVRLYHALGRPLPTAVVDVLHEVLRKVAGVDRGKFRSYIEALQAKAGELGPADRFMVSRIEGLERVVQAR